MYKTNDILNKIYCVDCFEFMKEMESKSVDIIFTDPPYKEEDIEGGEEYYSWLLKFFEEAKRITKDYLIMFNNASRLYDILQLLGKPYRILIWTKGVVKYAWRWEPIFIYSFEPPYKLNRTIWTDHLPYQPLWRRQSLHPYQKPLKLIKNILRFIPSDKIILDPFMGSGTTIVACKEMNRFYIGLEKEKKYYEVTKKNLSKIQKEMFC